MKRHIISSVVVLKALSCHQVERLLRLHSGMPKYSGTPTQNLKLRVTCNDSLCTENKVDYSRLLDHSNDHTFLAGRNPCLGRSKRAWSPRTSNPSNFQSGLKKKPTGQPVLHQRRGPAYSAGFRAAMPPRVPACSTPLPSGIGRAAASPAPIKVID